jgi:hypothetical protein
MCLKTLGDLLGSTERVEVFFFGKSSTTFSHLVDTARSVMGNAQIKVDTSIVSTDVAA